MTYFLGCDVSKLKLDLSLINEQGVQQWADNCVNDELAIASLLLTVIGAYPDDTLICVVESTGTYHFAMAETCYMLGLACRVFNPLITRQQIRATVRGKKTDKTDALMIARLGLRGEGRNYVPELYKTTKYYGRSCQRLATMSSSFLNYETHLRDLLEADMSPEFKAVLSGIQTAIRTAQKQLTADMALSARGPAYSLLQTIPGIGPTIAASLIGEVQDMQRFPTAKSFIAYAGLDPRIKQSGTTLNSTGRLTKRGSSYLRSSAFIAANVARQHDPQFRALYDKKRAEGKSYTVATCVVARKLLTVARSVWLSGEAYSLPNDLS
jgi:transposase